MVTAEKSRIDCRHIDVLDGIRAVSVIIVLIFHFWQQTWIFPVIKTPWLASVGITKIDFSNFATVGYLFVDMMVLISGFLLFLPLMRSIILGEEMSSWKNYARRRIARIVPSYYFAVLLLFFASALPTGAYATTADALKDLFAHLTFTQTLWVNTYIATPLDVVLWTVAIEVWFYVLFPFVAEFIKGPRNKNRQSFTPAYGIFFIFAVFNIINYVYTENFVLKGDVYLAMRINQFPAFLGVYSIGMLGASAFVLIAKNCRRSRIFNAVNTLFSVFSILLIVYLINDCVATQERHVWQVTERSKLAFVFMTFIITTALSSKWYRWLFSNKFMRFLSGISYNLYIWHQWLAVQCKNTWRIPKWSGEIPPNMLNITYWMNRYAVVITVFAFAAAILATYLIEKPFANLIMGRPVFPFFAKKHLKTANLTDEECISEEEFAPLSAEVDSFADTVDSDEPTENAAANPWGEQETDRNDSDCD